MSDAAITSIIAGLITITTMVVGFLTLWVKLRYGVKEVENKVDVNTAMTRAGTGAAAKAALAAATAASEAKTTTETIAESINKKFNGGGVELMIEAAVKPLRDALTDHVIHDDECMREIRDALSDLRKRVK